MGHRVGIKTASRFTVANALSSFVGGRFVGSGGKRDMAKLSVATPEQSRSGDPQYNRDVSFVRGGPFYRIQEAIRLLTPERWNLGRRILLAIAAGWVPLVVLTLLFKFDTIGDLLRDYTVNIRMLIAVPILLIGQVVMENVFRMIIHHLREADLLPALEQAKMDRTIESLIRLRDSFVAEAIIVIIAYGNVAANCEDGGVSRSQQSCGITKKVTVKNLVFQPLVRVAIDSTSFSNSDG
jgi:hypothetical protein